eukprot:TRINITY_DN5360_c0_g1_i1.p1 TRINITY_DN5360_c0_g1~~TRINITY_DN5360_c0_g1_i1.p1  ORF type:complete len:345 (+),score=16.78 TRINITY_DN5360_c0_g1_i1:119-1153(+)
MDDVFTCHSRMWSAYFHHDVPKTCCGVWAPCGDGLSPEMTIFLNETSPLLLAHIAAGRCPFGELSAVLQVTIPGKNVPEELLQEQIIAPITMFQKLAIVWSVIPGAVMTFVCVSLLFRRGIRQLSVFLYLLLAIGTGICVGPLDAYPRPGMFLQNTDNKGRLVGSCVPHCGFPCFYSMMSAGILVLFVADAVFRIQSESCLHCDPNRRRRSSTAGSLYQGPTSTRSLSSSEFRTAKTCLSFVSLSPWAPHGTLTHMESLFFFSFWALLMGPIPMMRVMLYDNTAGQAFAGWVVGITTGTVWALIVQLIVRRVTASGVNRIWGLTVNDFRPPDPILTHPSVVSSH